MKAPVVIVGAGIGGLAAAIRLAVSGATVTVFEKNASVGGKAGQVEQAGFRWDTGPSVITMRHVLEDLFAAAGRRLEDYLTLLPVEPLTRYFYPDGVRLDATRDLTEMVRQIEALEPRDVEGYLAYLSHAARLHRITGPVFIYDEAPGWRSFARVAPWEAFRVNPFGSMQGQIERYVRSPYLRQMLGRFATYVGASPYLASGTLNVIAHVELSGGVWYPAGGVHTIAEALRQLAAEVGVTIRTQAPVERIRLDGRRAIGVESGGEVVPARAVVANVDVATVYDKLLPQSHAIRRRAARLRRSETSCSGFVLLLGMDREFPALAHHNILFSRNYRKEFADIFERGVPPDDPTIYIAITSKTDPAHAPAGHENWFVLVNAPAEGAAFDWRALGDGYRDRVLDALAERGLNVRPHIVTEARLSPPDLARMTGAHRGALYGTSMNSLLAPFRRPRNRCPDVQGLYFAGGTTHPGGGVPMVMLSGKLVARQIGEDIGLPSHV